LDQLKGSVSSPKPCDACHGARYSGRPKKPSSLTLWLDFFRRESAEMSGGQQRAAYTLVRSLVRLSASSLTRGAVAVCAPLPDMVPARTHWSCGPALQCRTEQRLPHMIGMFATQRAAAAVIEQLPRNGSYRTTTRCASRQPGAPAERPPEVPTLRLPHQHAAARAAPVQLAGSRAVQLATTRVGDGWLVYLINTSGDVQGRRRDWFEMMKVNEPPLAVGPLELQVSGMREVRTVYGPPPDHVSLHDGVLHVTYAGFREHAVLHLTA